MTEVLSLAQIRALADAEENATPANVAEPEVEAEEIEEVPEPEADEEVEPHKDETEEKAESTEDDLEDWAKPEGDAVPVKKHVDMKHKFKRKLDDADGEIARLKAELEQLKSGVVSQSQAAAAPRLPLMSDEDVGYDEEKYAQRMAEYTEQMLEHKLSLREKQSSTQAKQQELERQVEAELDRHYDRAQALIDQGKISQENFEAATVMVKRAMNESLPNGEAVLDYLIAQLGEGSEKVIPYLGLKPSALTKLKEVAKKDPTGFALAAYLGEIKNKANSAAIVDKQSKSPRPDKPLNGTASVASKDPRKMYQAAVNAGNVSGAIAAKRLARENKIDTSNW